MPPQQYGMMKCALFAIYYIAIGAPPMMHQQYGTRLLILLLLAS